MVAIMGSRSDDAAEALLITGPCGAGKSTVGFACLNLLRAEAVQAAMVDAELVYLSTAPEDPRNELIAEQGLAAVYRVYADAGIRRLLLPRVLLYPRHLELVSRAVPNASLTTAWLDVSDGVLAQRLEGRESGDSVRWHLDRARAVKQSGMRELADLQLNGERAPEAIAADLLAHVRWLPRLMGTQSAPRGGARSGVIPEQLARRGRRFLWAVRSSGSPRWHDRIHVFAVPEVCLRFGEI